MGDFNKACTYLIEVDEGGFVNNPNDRGGKTNWGISQKLFDTWRYSHSGGSLEDLTEDEARQIYKVFFWDTLKLDEVKDPIASALFDMAVNMGLFPATKCAQQALVNMAPDGIIGSKTIEALNNSEPHEFLYNFVRECQDHYVEVVKTIPGDLQFLKSWIRRAHRLMLLGD